MSTTVLTNRLELKSLADTALKAAARFWFVVAAIGQLLFAIAIASFYGLTALRGDYHRWSRSLSLGLVAGDPVGNLAFGMHVFSAVVVLLAGALQLIPRIRARFPIFHRWNGRIYVLTAVTLSVAGLYMTWTRSIGDLSSRLGSTLNALLIWICAAEAVRYAVARDFRTHRRWALRLFLVATAAWFFRVGLFLTLVIFKGPVGFDPTTLRGPLLTFMSFGQYLVPLAILEIYLRVQDRPGRLGRMATAVTLFALTLAMGVGILAVTRARWVPDVKAGFDSRPSIAETLSATISSRGVDEAVKQYRELKAASAATYNFDERELNTLGYQLIGARKLKEAIRILQLNVDAYPRSGNVYDSLAEAYMDGGNKPLAIANYRQSLSLNPNNLNATVQLRKLGVR